MPAYLLAFLAALVVVLAGTPLVKRLAIWLSAIDMPHDRKVHENPTPTLGGIAIFFGVLIAVLAVKLLATHTGWLSGPEGMENALATREFLGILIASAMILLFGIIDDLRRLSPWVKVGGQVIATLTLISFGVSVGTISLRGGSTIDLSGSPLLSIVLTIAWMVFFTNIINLIDGLDGLAAGIAAIAAGAFFFYGTQVGLDDSIVQAMVIAAAVGGAALGFLRYNFNPARIFMGDCGAQFLGFILGAISLQGILKRTAFASLFTPLIVLAVPMADTLLAVIRRARARQPFHHADKEHIHHRLLQLGHSQRQAVLLIYFWTALLTGIALAREFVRSRTIIYGLLVLAVVSLLLTAMPRLLKSDDDEASASPDPEDASGASGEE
ncbi:MAG: MraY family glycosyltransferase [Candidatus Geothermincolia bacterium]